MKKIAHISGGAASAAAAILSNADVFVYAETHSEHKDNQRFLHDIEQYTGIEITRVSNPDYKDTFDLWRKAKYLRNRFGAPCTLRLKRWPMKEYEVIPVPHVFGYTIDEQYRAEKLRRLMPDSELEFPLIDKGFDSKNAKGFIESLGIELPVTYAMGMKHANCIPCVKATSASYWNFIKDNFPKEFEMMADIEEKLDFQLVYSKGSYVTLKNLPDVNPSTVDQPECDLLCQSAVLDVKSC